MKRFLACIVCLQEGHSQQSYNLPIIRVDPDNRCAAMLVYGQQLVILPFRRDTVMDNVDSGASSTR